MDNKPTSPFSGLDKALLRPTKPTPPPTAAIHQQINEEKHTVHSAQNNEPTSRPSDEATERPPDRGAGDYELVRRGFEWYAYQLRKLKKLSLKEQMEGKPGSMSAMLRDALDDYLKKRASEL